MHKVYPYLLRGVAITRPNQVWSIDLTYIRLSHGFAYLVAVIDWYSRCVLSFRLSNSMDGRGRVFDNIFVERLWRTMKYEDIYLRGYASMGELQQGLTAYFAFYNHERPHQALSYKTPNEVYQAAVGGGAMILDKYGHHMTVASNVIGLTVSGRRCSAANRVECVS
jgi:putative transposase